ncbi:hypothetical protein MUK42_12738 [Musa troglodytarum]|uniref:Uncharacterized protein n=1 Tax=Musa troglodytarum TaxID=320322 RepID=A0A9E7HXV5_9LILI|nr:hypothetical protein MUK42_12738 [Musa troglodytarum]
MRKQGVKQKSRQGRKARGRRLSSAGTATGCLQALKHLVATKTATAGNGMLPEGLSMQPSSSTACRQHHCPCSHPHHFCTPLSRLCMLPEAISGSCCAHHITPCQPLLTTSITISLIASTTTWKPHRGLIQGTVSWFLLMVGMC